MRAGGGGVAVRADEGTAVVEVADAEAVVVEVTVPAVTFPACSPVVTPLCTFSERASPAFAEVEAAELAEAFLFTKRCSRAS